MSDKLARVCGERCSKLIQLLAKLMEKAPGEKPTSAAGAATGSATLPRPSPPKNLPVLASRALQCLASSLGFVRCPWLLRVKVISPTHVSMPDMEGDAVQAGATALFPDALAGVTLWCAGVFDVLPSSLSQICCLSIQGLFTNKIKAGNNNL